MAIAKNRAESPESLCVQSTPGIVPLSTIPDVSRSTEALVIPTCTGDEMVTPCAAFDHPQPARQSIAKNVR